MTDSSRATTVCLLVLAVVLVIAMMQQRTTRQTGGLQALATRAGLSSFGTLDYEFDPPLYEDPVEPYARTYPVHNWGTADPQTGAEPEWLTSVDVRPENAERGSLNRGGKQ